MFLANIQNLCCNFLSIYANIRAGITPIFEYANRFGFLYIHTAHAGRKMPIFSQYIVSKKIGMPRYEVDVSLLAIRTKICHVQQSLGIF